MLCSFRVRFVSRGLVPFVCFVSLSPLCLVSLVAVLASLGFVFLLFPFASSGLFGSGCRCPSSLVTLSFICPVPLSFACLCWWVRGVWFLIHVSSACFFHCCLALSRDGGFWHNFGSCIALLTCLYCDFNVISLLLDTLPLGVSGLKVSGRFLRCFRPELPPGRGDCVKGFARNVPVPPKLRQRRNDAGQLGDSSSGFAAWRSC